MKWADVNGCLLKWTAIFFVDAKLPPWLAGNCILLLKRLLIRMVVIPLFFTESLQGNGVFRELDFIGELYFYMGFTMSINSAIWHNPLKKNLIE